MVKRYFRNVKTGKRYEIVKLVLFDKENGEVTLKGEYSTFVEPFNKERFKRMGYVAEKEDAEQ